MSMDEINEKRNRRNLAINGKEKNPEPKLLMYAVTKKLHKNRKGRKTETMKEDIERGPQRETVRQDRVGRNREKKRVRNREREKER